MHDRDKTHINMVHWVAHEHMVQAKVLNFPEGIEDSDMMSSCYSTELFVVSCVGARRVNMVGSLQQWTTGSADVIPQMTRSFPAAACVITRRLSGADLD